MKHDPHSFPVLKIFSLVLFVLLFSLSLSHADPASDALVKDAAENAKAIEKNDIEAIVSRVYPGLTEKVGGKDKMLAAMKGSSEAMQSRGTTIESLVMGAPGPIVTSGDKMYSVVPSTIVMKTKTQKITLKSFFLAVSLDKGATWTFLQGDGVNPDQILDIIPDFPETVTLPAKQPALKEPL